MRIERLNQKGNDRVILFFNGWGMDARAVSHLEGTFDILVFYDYHNMNVPCEISLDCYRETNVIAWSMGVWAAANVIPEMNIRFSKLIALNGTECPIEDRLGIPVKVYQLTEKNMDERGREKFLQRMLNGKEEIQRFEQNKPQRSLEDVCEELVMIRRQSTGLQNKLNWDKIYISEKDVIFPVVNQQNWWQDKCAELRMLPGGHYPFYSFRSWEEIIG